MDRIDGLERTWCCLFISAVDLAKFGRLYLHNGEWNGIKILSSDWVITSTKNGVYTPEEWPDEFVNSGLTNYKYQWWLASEAYNAYTTIGKDGQYLYIDPDKNLIIIRLGDGVGDVSWIWLFQEIAKGIQ